MTASNKTRNWSIVDDNELLVEETAQNLTLNEAEHALCRYLNMGFDCYMYQAESKNNNDNIREITL